MSIHLKIGLLATALSPLFIACTNDSKGSETISDSATAKNANGHEHSFRCAMHPEVVGKEGDTCPKCGMKLEHSDTPPDATGTYFMKFTSMPASIEPNKEVTLSFTPKKKDANAEQVALDIEHERKIHLILVSDDLSWFDHIHPEFNTDGSYTVKTKFPAPGNYKAFADYKPTGGTHMVDKIEVTVKGNPPAGKTFSGEKLSGSSGNYSFELKPEAGKLVTGTPLHILGIIKKEGKEMDATALDNYLGAKAHFVLISLNEKEYLHVHPSISEGKFDLHTTIDKPGTYRGWIQFNADGKIHTIDFTMNIMQGSADGAQKANDGHNSSSKDHSNH